MYCAWRIPAHLRCTQCSILLHLMDICFLTCICLWQISQIQTFLFKIVGPGLVSTSPAFVSCSASHPAGPHGRHAQNPINRAHIVVSQISRREDLLPFIPFLFFHCVDQLRSSLQCTFTKRVARMLSFVCFIEAIGLLRETRYIVLSTSSWNASSGNHT